MFLTGCTLSFINRTNFRSFDRQIDDGNSSNCGGCDDSPNDKHNNDNYKNGNNGYCSVCKP